MIIEGEHTTADVKLPEEHIEESLKDEIQEQVDHEAFQNPIAYQPDVHGGLGPHAIVGFSMKLGDRVVPNTIGGDIGCGMTAVKLDKTDVDFDDIDDLRDVNDEVRSTIPMGRGRVRSWGNKDFSDLYPWEHANSTLLQLFDFRGRTPMEEEEFEAFSFDEDYFDELCQRVGISKKYATNSLGSLGGGNHFIEVSESQEKDSLWVVVHSGSRNLGQKVKAFHQKDATFEREHEIAWDEMSPEERQYTMSDGSPNWEKIKRAYDSEEINEMGERIQSFSSDSSRNTDLDYLKRGERFGYLRDMVFAQQYATTNRRLMARDVAAILDAEITKVVNSPHNYIDFHDGVIRKGSTRALDGEQFVVPLNMEDGTLVCRGKGNAEWNNSAPHGAGRLGSRGWAHDTFDADEARQRMYANGTYSANVPADEVPGAYKETQLIEEQIKPTADVVDRLKPVMNFKS